jgi:hypothetical protein
MQKTHLSPFLVFLWGFGGGNSHAQNSPQNYIELRGAGSENGFYRYMEFSHAFRNRAMLDVVYIGVPGQNELYAGFGYRLRATSTLTVTPLLYAAVGKESGQRGVVVGTLVVGTVQNWSINSFWAHFEPIAGSVPRYTFLDSLDVSRKIRQWEVGVSAGFLQVSGEWNPLVGPVVIHNDKWGSWRLYGRGGSASEVRVSRTFSF